VLRGDPRSTVGSGSEADEFVESGDGTEATPAEGTEATSAPTVMGPPKAQTKARAPNRERRVEKGTRQTAARADRRSGYSGCGQRGSRRRSSGRLDPTWSDFSSVDGELCIKEVFSDQGALSNRDSDLCDFVSQARASALINESK
jgi:hypothetical protein